MQRRTWLLVRRRVGCASVACVACGQATSSVDGSASVGDDLGGGADAGGGRRDRRRRAISPAPSTAFVYVSGYSTTIARYTLDATTGALTAMGTTTATGSSVVPRVRCGAPARLRRRRSEQQGRSVRHRRHDRRAHAPRRRRRLRRQRAGASRRRRQRQVGARRQLRIGRRRHLAHRRRRQRRRGHVAARRRQRARGRCSTPPIASRGCRASAPITSRNIRSTRPPAR